MLRLLSDEDFHGFIVRGLLRSEPNIDLVRVQDVGLSGAADQDVLEWAAEHGRILVTHDKATMPDCSFNRVRSGQTMLGVFVVSRRMTRRQAIEELVLLATCSKASDWDGIILYLPL